MDCAAIQKQPARGNPPWNHAPAARDCLALPVAGVILRKVKSDGSLPSVRGVPMPDETPIPVLINPAPVENTEPAEVLPPTAELAPSPPTPEEARAVEAVFSQQDESRLVAGLRGLYAGAMVLRDIAVDTFTTSEEEEEDEPNPRKKKGQPEDKVV